MQTVSVGSGKPPFDLRMEELGKVVEVEDGGWEVKDATGSQLQESQLGILKTEANRGERPDPPSSLVSIATGTTARCS